MNLFSRKNLIIFFFLENKFILKRIFLIWKQGHVISIFEEKKPKAKLIDMVQSDLKIKLL